jgi:hypothetical protein
MFVLITVSRNKYIYMSSVYLFSFILQIFVLSEVTVSEWMEKINFRLLYNFKGTHMELMYKKQYIVPGSSHFV